MGSHLPRSCKQHTKEATEVQVGIFYNSHFCTHMIYRHACGARASKSRTASSSHSFLSVSLSGGLWTINPFPLQAVAHSREVFTGCHLLLHFPASGERRVQPGLPRVWLQHHQHTHTAVGLLVHCAGDSCRVHIKAMADGQVSVCATHGKASKQPGKS